MKGKAEAPEFRPRCCYHPGTLSTRVLRANKLAAAPRAETGSSIARISGRPAILPLRAPVSGLTEDEVVDRTSTLDSNTFKTGKFVNATFPFNFSPTFERAKPKPNSLCLQSRKCGLV